MKVLQAGTDLSMTDRFGMGFYSEYLVSEKVTMTTNRNNYESSVGGSFILRTVTGEPLSQRTKVNLHLKEDQTE